MKLNGLVTDISLSITLEKKRSITLFKALIDSHYLTTPEILFLYNSRSISRLKIGDRVKLFVNRVPVSNLINFTYRVETVSIYL